YLCAAHAVAGREKESAVDIRQAAGVCAGLAGVDVFDDVGAGRTAIARPELHSMAARAQSVVVGDKKQSAVHVRQVEDRTWGFDEYSSGAGAITPPKSRRRIVGREK